MTKDTQTSVTPATDEQVTHYEKAIGSFVMTSQSYEHVILALIARIRASEPVWQDIATAPRDGTVVLVINGPNTKGFYTQENQMGTASWDRQSFPDAKMEWCAVDCCDGVTTYEPTHWRPLPSPPKPLSYEGEQS